MLTLACLSQIPPASVAIWLAWDKGLGGIMVSTLVQNARHVGSIPFLGAIVPIFITPSGKPTSWLVSSQLGYLGSLMQSHDLRLSQDGHCLVAVCIRDNLIVLLHWEARSLAP